MASRICFPRMQPCTPGLGQSTASSWETLRCIMNEQQTSGQGPDRDKYLNVKLLKIFSLVGKRLQDDMTNFRSITSVAVALGISKNDVFYTLDELDKHYGLELVDRQNARLTETGRAVLVWAHRVVDEYERGHRLPVDGKEQVVLGVSGLAATFVLPTVVSPFLLRENGKVHISIHEGTGTDLLMVLRRGLLQAVLCQVPDTIEHGYLVHHTLQRGIPTVMIASKDNKPWGNRQTWEDWQMKIRLTDISNDQAVCIFEEDLEEVLPALRKLSRTQSLVSVRRYSTIMSVLGPGMVGFVPLLKEGHKEFNYPGHDELAMYFIHEADRIPTRSFGLWYRQDEPPSGATERFLSMVAAQFGTTPTWGAPIDKPEPPEVNVTPP